LRTPWRSLFTRSPAEMRNPGRLRRSWSHPHPKGTRRRDQERRSRQKQKQDQRQEQKQGQSQDQGQGQGQGQRRVSSAFGLQSRAPRGKTQAQAAARPARNTS